MLLDFQLQSPHIPSDLERSRIQGKRGFLARPVPPAPRGEGGGDDENDVTRTKLSLLNSCCHQHRTVDGFEWLPEVEGCKTFSIRNTPNKERGGGLTFDFSISVDETWLRS